MSTLEMWRWGRRVGAKRLGECVKDDIEELGLHSEWAVFRDMWRDFISGQPLTLAERGRNRHF